MSSSLLEPRFFEPPRPSSTHVGTPRLLGYSLPKLASGLLEATVVPARMTTDPSSDGRRQATSVPGPADHAVSVVDSGAALAGLRSEWNGLLETSREASAFLSWEWQEAWWRIYGAGRGLRIYTRYRGGRLVGILPLYHQRVGVVPGLTCGRLRLVGSGGDTSPDYLGALLDPDGEEETAAALVNHVLDDRGWDALWLSDVREESPVAVALQAALARRRERLHIGPSTRITFLPLAASWETLLAGLDAHWRQEVRRRRRRLEERGARCVLLEDPAKLDVAFDRLGELHRLRWTRRAERHSFSTPEYLQFHREVMRRFLKRGWLRLFALQLGDQAIAMRYCFRFRHEVFAFQSGFDPAYDRLSPGSVLMSHVVEHSIREGARVVDMLKGEYPHKKSWSTEQRTTTSLRVYRPTLSGLLWMLRERELPALVRSARSRLTRSRR